MTTDTVAIARVGLLELERVAGSTIWIDAHGPSMSPSIPAGSRLLVELGRQPVGVGEVILVRARDGLIAHRLVARRAMAGAPQLIAKGDGEALADRPVGADAVIGIVRAVEPPADRRASSALGGRRASFIAHTSWWGDRIGRAGRRLARRMPGSTRPPATRAALGLSRVPTRLLLATMLRLDRGRFAGRR